MSNFHTQVTFITESNNDGLKEYPNTSKYTHTFDATDLTIYGYVEQFRCFLRAAGFAEKGIEDALGEF